MALLLVGGVVLPVVGWIVGAVLLWGSEAWTRREKLVGTLVVPGGLLAAVFLVSGTTYVESCVETGGPGGGVETTCTGGPSQLAQILGIVLVIVLFVAPIVSAVYLLRRARGGSSGHAGSAVR